MKEKKKGEKTKRRMEEGLGTIHLEKLILEKSSVSIRGFPLEIHSAPRIRQ